MTKSVLCVDIGTSSIKASAIDECGQSYFFAREHFQYCSKSSDIWFCALQNVFIKLNKECPDLEIEAITVSGNGPSVIFGSNRVLWNESVDRSIIPPSCKSSLFLPYILHLKNKYPADWQSFQKVFLGPEYLIYQLTGTEVSILPEKRFLNAYWTNEMLSACGIDEDKLPPFVEPGYFAGEMLESVKQQFGIASYKKIKVFCGAPDFIVALIGTNTLGDGKLCDRAGTSEGLNLCSKKIVRADKIRTLPSVLKDYNNAGYLIPESGKSFSDFKKSSEKYNQMSYDDCVSCILKEGFASPGFSIIMKILSEIKAGIDILRKASGFSLDIMSLTGGQARNKVWNQLKSDFLNVNLIVTQNVDAELTGDAIIAQCALKRYSDLQEAAANMVKVGFSYEPDLKKHDFYRNWMRY